MLPYFCLFTVQYPHNYLLMFFINMCWNQILLQLAEILSLLLLHLKYWYQQKVGSLRYLEHWRPELYVLQQATLNLRKPHWNSK